MRIPFSREYEKVHQEITMVHTTDQESWRMESM